jgi:hypothetical protein
MSGRRYYAAILYSSKRSLVICKAKSVYGEGVRVAKVGRCSRCNSGAANSCRLYFLGKVYGEAMTTDSGVLMFRVLSGGFSLYGTLFTFCGCYYFCASIRGRLFSS